MPAQLASFKLLKCFATDDFKCKIGKGHKVTWTRRNSSEDVAEVDLFKVSVKTPKLRGTYEIPAVQTYSDGTVVNWDEPAGDPEPPHPAPTIRVQGEDAA